MVVINMDGPKRDQVLKLIYEKDRIESEIRNEGFVLESNNVGMRDSLVDAEGFPRNDIDVYTVSHARQRIICLQNDLKKIMESISSGLIEIHAETRGTYGDVSSPPTALPTTSAANGHASGGEDMTNVPFAIVTFVDEGSPADIDGLCTDDKILQFGSINHTNFVDMPQVLNIVGHSIGQPIPVKIRREHQVHCLTLTPRPWGKPGLLGCHINIC